MIDLLKTTHWRIHGLQAVVLFFLLTGCCSPGDPPDPNNGLHGILLRNPTMVFTDSTGSNAVFELTVDESYKYEHPENRDNGCTDYVGAWRMTFYQQEDLASRISYDQRYGWLNFPGLQFSLWSPAYDSVVTIQGRQFNHVEYKTVADTSGTIIEELLFDELFGPIMFRNGDEYRWERVIQ